MAVQMLDAKGSSTITNIVYITSHAATTYAYIRSSSNLTVLYAYYACYIHIIAIHHVNLVKTAQSYFMLNIQFVVSFVITKRYLNGLCECLRRRRNCVVICNRGKMRTCFLINTHNWPQGK